MKPLTKLLILGLAILGVGLATLGVAVGMAAILLFPSAHAEIVSTHATFYPCPNGPGQAVVAVDEDGNETWAGCWGSDPAPVDRDDDRRQKPSLIRK